MFDKAECNIGSTHRQVQQYNVGRQHNVYQDLIQVENWPYEHKENKYKSSLCSLIKIFLSKILKTK